MVIHDKLNIDINKVLLFFPTFILFDVILGFLQRKVNIYFATFLINTTDIIFRKVFCILKRVFIMERFIRVHFFLQEVFYTNFLKHLKFQLFLSAIKRRYT